jgi:CRP-like cAMP-binding protein
MQNNLGKFKPFERLMDEECALIERSGEWVRARKGQIIIAEQKSNKAFYIVAEGSVNVRLVDSSGTNIELASHGPGMMIGEYSFVDGLPAAASAVTATEAVLFRITHQKLNEILEKHDRIGRIVYRNLLGILVERLRATNAELDLFGT